MHEINQRRRVEQANKENVLPLLLPSGSGPATGSSSDPPPTGPTQAKVHSATKRAHTEITEKYRREQKRRHAAEKQLKNSKRREERLRKNQERLENEVRVSKEEAKQKMADIRGHLVVTETENARLRAALAAAQDDARVTRQLAVTADQQRVLQLCETQRRADMYILGAHKRAEAAECDARDARLVAEVAHAEAVSFRDTAAEAHEAAELRVSEASMRAARAEASERAMQKQAESSEHQAREEAHRVWGYAMQAIKAMDTEYTQRAAYLDAHVCRLVNRLEGLSAEVEAQSTAAITEERLRAEAAILEAETAAEVAIQELQALQTRFDATVEENETYLAQARAIMERTAAEQPVDTAAQLTEAMQRSATLQERALNLQKKNDALRKKVKRFPAQRQRSMEKGIVAALAGVVASSSDGILRLKEGNKIPHSMRALVRDLVAKGLKLCQVSPAISTMAQAMGVRVEGEISDRSVRRIVEEGWVLSVLQIVSEVHDADGENYDKYDKRLF